MVVKRSKAENLEVFVIGIWARQTLTVAATDAERAAFLAPFTRDCPCSFTTTLLFVTFHEDLKTYLYRSSRMNIWDNPESLDFIDSSLAFMNEGYYSRGF